MSRGDDPDRRPPGVAVTARVALLTLVAVATATVVLVLVLLGR
jgi:hypothetical protein